LKLPVSDGTRAEVRLPLARAVRIVPAALRRMVRVRTDDEALAPVAEVTTERTVQNVLDADHRVLVEVADDRVVARRLAGGSRGSSRDASGAGDEEGKPLEWRELEVELVHGDRRLLQALDARLREHGIELSGNRSKVGRVLGQDSASPASASPASERQQLRPGSPAGEVVMDYLAGQVEQVLAHDPLVRLDRPDSVHKMRVATRRLRSALQTFKPLFDPDVVRPLRAELKWLAGVLGAARDAEVLRDRLGDAVRADGGQAGLEMGAPGAAEEMAQAYRTAYERLLVELDAERYHQLVGALGELVRTPPLRPIAARKALKVLPARVARGYTALKAEVKAAHGLPAGAERDHHLHEARKAAKRVRYAGETLSAAFGKDAVGFAAAMEDLQEVLGEHQDSVVMRERLLALAGQDRSTPEGGFAYGRLHALEEARGREAEEAFDAVWEVSSAKKLRRWLR
ncbi:MAG: CYTH and CHAD domain-containing protein, partial [Actinomycetota bacterium]|nr:CYTH and CHAD domain-containing protein [Actinomycetota bacterium]